MKGATNEAPSNAISLTPFFLVTLFLLLLWQVVTTSLYGLVSHSPPTSLAERAQDKWLQMLLLCSSLSLPLLVRSLHARAASLMNQPWWEWGCALALVITAALLFGPWLPVFGMAIGVLMVRSAPQERIRSPRRNLVQAFLWIVTAVAILWFAQQRNFMPRIDLYEDGPRLGLAQAFLLHQQPSRDFALHYGILQEVVKPLLAFRIWETTYEAYLRMNSWLSALSTLGLFAIASVLMRSRLLLVLLGMGICWRGNLVIPDRVWPVVWVIFCAAYGWIHGQRRWFVAAGVGQALALLYSLEIGMTLSLGLLVFLGMTIMESRHRETRQQELSWLWPWICGLFAVMAIFFCYLIVIGGWQEWIEDTLRTMLQRSASWSEGLSSRHFRFPWRKPIYQFDSYVYIHHIPLLVVAVLSYCWTFPSVGRPSGQRMGVVALSCILFTSYFTYIGRSDYTHWLVASPLVLPLAAIIMDRLLERLRCLGPYSLRARTSTAAWLVGLGLPLIVVIGGNQSALSFLANGTPLQASTFTHRQTLPVTMPVRWGHVDGPEEELRDIARIVSRIRSLVPPDGYLFDFSRKGVIYFLCERRNPTRFVSVDTPLIYPELNAVCLRDLEKRRPEVILTQQHGQGLECLVNLEPLCGFIRERYVLFEQIGQWGIWVPQTFLPGQHPSTQRPPKLSDAGIGKKKQYHPVSS